MLLLEVEAVRLTYLPSLARDGTWGASLPNGPSKLGSARDQLAADAELDLLVGRLPYCPKTGPSPISRCLAVVVVQKSAESLTPREGTATAGLGGSRDEPTAQALVRSFLVVVRDILAHELSEMRLAQ